MCLLVAESGPDPFADLIACEPASLLPHLAAARPAEVPEPRLDRLLARANRPRGHQPAFQPQDAAVSDHPPRGLKRLARRELSHRLLQHDRPKLAGLEGRGPL